MTAPPDGILTLYGLVGSGGPMTTRTLTEAAVVDAALRVVQRSGLDALSMRALSRELGMSHMAAYYYVANKDELLELVASRALADIAVPEPDAGDWTVRLRTLIDRIDDALRTYRGVGEVLLDRMHRTQKHVMRGVMEILADAGFSDADVAMAYALIHTYLFGRYQVVGFSADIDAPDLEDTLAELLPHLADLHGHDFFSYGIDTIIEGLRAQLAATTPRRKTRASQK